MPEKNTLELTRSENKKEHHLYAMWFSIIVTIVNVLIAFIILKHSFPLSIFPAINSFLIIYKSVKNKMPRKKHLLLFSMVYYVFLTCALLILSGYNNIGKPNFSLLLEPIFFIPVTFLILKLKKKIPSSKYISIVNVIVGGTLITFSIILMIPGNPIIEFFENPKTGYWDFLDSHVSPKTIVGLLFFYHVPIGFLSFGGAAFVIGLLNVFSRFNIRNNKVYSLITSSMLAVYVVGVSITWLILENEKPE
ncbi:MAG: hypothetical protein ACTSVI_17335 [Promethearchaeota archaeon]